jgi:hypothetical protein
MSLATLDKLIWALIYGGLLALCLGLFVQREHVPLGATLVTAGALVAVAGVALIWVRSRRTPPVRPPPSKERSPS